MARTRKTIDVDYLREHINARISHEKTPDARRQLCIVLENILHYANVYRGFRYLDGWDAERGEDWRHEYF